MKYFILISQLAAILFLILDLFEIVYFPVLRVAAYGVIVLGLMFTLVIAAQKNKA